MTFDTDTMVNAYVECALWSSHDDARDPEGCGPMLDANYGPEDIAPDRLAEMRADCVAFAEANADDLADLDPEQVGHDFWLTRNRHGAGFWDRGLGAVGARLTEAAHAYGESYLYSGDDGRIYVS